MAKDIFAKELEKVEKVAHKLRNNMKRADIDFTVQVSRNTADPGTTRWALSMTAPANGLSPIVFIAYSSEELIKQIKESIKNIDYQAVEIAYHNAQIEACNRTILGHKERIELIEKGEAYEVYVGDDEAADEATPDEPETVADEQANEEADTEAPQATEERSK